MAFSFYVIDPEHKIRLSNAVFEISQNNNILGTSFSNSNGEVRFRNLYPGKYLLKQVSAPNCYLLDTTVHVISVLNNGYIDIDDTINMRYFVVYNYSANTIATTPQIIEHQNIDIQDKNIDIQDKNIDIQDKNIDIQDKKLTDFKFRKLNFSNIPLEGAIYNLMKNNTVIQVSVSDISGNVIFSNLETGTYTLIESSPPAGYRASSINYYVIVTDDGNITVSGMSPENFYPVTLPIAFNMAIHHVDSVTSIGIKGSVFELLASGNSINTTTSDASGKLFFKNLKPTSYTLKEVSPARGYKRNNHEYDVMIRSNGIIKINGIAVHEFKLKSNKMKFNICGRKSLKRGSKFYV